MKNKVHIWAKLASALFLATIASGCGIADGALRKPNAGDDARGDKSGQNGDAVANGSVVDLVMFPPKEYYDYLLASAFDLVDRDQVVNQFAMPQALWLNFDGGTVHTSSAQLQQSFLLMASLKRTRMQLSKRSRRFLRLPGPA